MKIIYFLLPTLFIIACANNVAEKKATSESKLNDQNEGNGTSMSETSASIKIFHNGKPFVEYSPPLPKALRMTEKSGKEKLLIELDNSDNTYSLMGTLQTVASGTYHVDEEGKSDAQFQLVTDDTKKIPFMLNFTRGSLTITITSQTCSGNFTGADYETNTNSYEINGSFKDIPITKINAGQTP